MDKFSEAYAAAQSALKIGTLGGGFGAQQHALSLLLAGAAGPDVAQSKSLDKLRETAAADAKAVKGSTGERAVAKALVAGAGDGRGLVERAATLKMLKHLHHVKSAGGQQIWVYSPPDVYTKWIFDECAGKSATGLEDVLAKSSPDVYSPEQCEVMVDAVQNARALALNVVAKLGAAASAETLAVVRRYFGNASSSKADLEAVMGTLASGYQKIANACNAGNIIISDEPGDRTSGGWKDWAFIYTAEKMSVIYLQGAWLKKAGEITPSNQPPLWRCVRTVIHELSHKECSTEDVVYGPNGLKPEGSSALTPAYALHNADSWAYFAVDVMGYLTGPDKANGEKPTTAIREVPVRTLTA